MDSVILLDWKRFCLTFGKSDVYLTLNESFPHRTTKSKHFILELKFLSAVARPRNDFTKKSFFDSRIGIWTFAKLVTFHRYSRNRPAKTLEMKPVAVAKDVFRKLLIENVLPNKR